jgi:hypothetical protein
MPDADQAVPNTTAPSDLSWSLFQTVPVPSSPTAGPGVVSDDGNVAKCFADTPVGGLVAELQISTRYLISPAWRTVVADQVMPSPGRTFYVRARSAIPTVNAPGDYCTPSAYSILSYARGRETVEVVSQCGANLQATTGTVVWRGGDWRLLLQPNGGESPHATQVASEVGFVSFGSA